MAKGDRSIMLSVMMFEETIAALYAIVPSASTPRAIKPFVEPERGTFSSVDSSFQSDEVTWANHHTRNQAARKKEESPSSFRTRAPPASPFQRTMQCSSVFFATMWARREDPRLRNV